jgi:hypothetical protein
VGALGRRTIMGAITAIVSVVIGFLLGLIPPWIMGILATESPISSTGSVTNLLFQRLGRNSKAVPLPDCSELMSANIYVYAADVYVALQLG